MDIEDRERLIAAYYQAVDAEEYATFEDLFTPDAHHIRPGQGVLVGGAAVREYYETERTATNTTHRVGERFHGESRTLCTVEVSGEKASERFARPVVGAFDFDGEAERLSAYRVYRGSVEDPDLTPA
jgi:ketosteroid isomerase-like protein